MTHSRASESHGLVRMPVGGADLYAEPASRIVRCAGSPKEWRVDLEGLAGVTTTSPRVLPIRIPLRAHLENRARPSRVRTMLDLASACRQACRFCAEGVPHARKGAAGGLLVSEALEWTHDPLHEPPLSRCAHAGLYASEVSRRSVRLLSLPDCVGGAFSYVILKPTFRGYG